MEYLASMQLPIAEANGINYVTLLKEII